MKHECHSIDIIKVACKCGKYYRATLYCCGDQEPHECYDCEKKRQKEEYEIAIAAYHNRERQRRADNAKLRDRWRQSIARQRENRN